MKFEERFGGTPLEDNAWQFDLKEDWNGGFGGTAGGVLSALTVLAARGLAPGRFPSSVDSRFIRGFRPGLASVVPTLVNAGRSISTVMVDIVNEEGKLCTRSTVTLIVANALAEVEAEDAAGSLEGMRPQSEAKVWPQSRSRPIPLVDTFQPAFMGADDRGTATRVDVVWNEGGLAEAICIAADLSVGPPVARALQGKPLAMPNPDISLRFCRETELPQYLVASCRLDCMESGLATTRIEVRAEDKLVANGISTTTCLRGK
jgi:acyl-coenzyme A thioesterase PaaI-like protein